MNRWRSYVSAITRGGILLFLFTPTLLGQGGEDRYFDINKGIDLFGTIYREVMLNYVDEVDPSGIMEAGIRGMLSALDPYTIFIDESNKSDVDMLTKGKYGGIGITVGLRDGIITITGIMEGYSAEREGLRIGDHILEVDGHPVSRIRPEEVRHYMRGVPGSPVRLRVERPARADTFEVTLKREEISLKNIGYEELIEGDIGLIKLERFGRSAGEDVRAVLKRFKDQASLRGIILDLRNNPGGLLDAAVAVVENFVPRGSLIVSTRGRKPSAQREYWTEEEPLYPSIPLVVIINKASASASEIVAGAIQDLDRGVLIGTRTFGKGLVQNVLPLSYNTSLKLTTARYYTPSGRCIQEIDYSRSDSTRNHEQPDSTRKRYQTLVHKRIVYEAGGISPDTVLEPSGTSNYAQQLQNSGTLFEFVTQLRNSGEGHTIQHVDDTILQSFQDYLELHMTSQRNTVRTLVGQLRKSIEEEQYDSTVHSVIDDLERRVTEQQKGDFRRNHEEIQRLLEIELSGRVYGDAGRIRTSYRYDTQLATAASIIRNRSDYERLVRKPH